MQIIDSVLLLPMACNSILEIVILLIIFLIYILNLLVQCYASSLQT